VIAGGIESKALAKQLLDLLRLNGQASEISRVLSASGTATARLDPPRCQRRVGLPRDEARSALALTRLY
jgi:hypothetical protein